MRLRVAGAEYSRFPASSVTAQLDALSRTFSFEATSSGALPLPFRGGEECEVFLGDDRVLVGFIELVNVSGDEAGHQIDIQGRDRTADLVDSSIGSLSDLQPPISLATIARRVIAHIDATIEVLDLARPAAFRTVEDLVAPEPGENAFEFLEKLARKRQVLLTADGDGRLTITRGSGVESLGRIQNLVGTGRGAFRGRADGNTVLSYSASYDTTGRFNAYQTLSQLSPIPLATGSGIDAEVIASQGGVRVIRDQAIRRGRQLVLVSEASYSSLQGGDRATWEAKVRRSRGQVYSPVVDGFRNQAGELWTPNTLVQVVDEYAGIDSKMLINSVTFALDESGGSTTTLSLVERDAYTLALAEPREEEALGLGLAS
jgi:prophage tail gpP-like protein